MSDRVASRAVCCFRASVREPSVIVTSTGRPSPSTLGLTRGVIRRNARELPRGRSIRKVPVKPCLSGASSTFFQLPSSLRSRPGRGSPGWPSPMRTRTATSGRGRPSLERSSAIPSWVSPRVPVVFMESHTGDEADALGLGSGASPPPHAAVTVSAARAPARRRYLNLSPRTVDRRDSRGPRPRRVCQGRCLRSGWERSFVIVRLSVATGRPVVR